MLDPAGYTGLCADMAREQASCAQRVTQHVDKAPATLASLAENLAHRGAPMDTFDYVIIGAGSAGSVLASRLTEDANVTVCLLEAGPRDTNPMIHIPAGFMKTFYDSNVNWCYEQEPGPYTAGRRIYAPRGKTLGGSSSINGHIINRGQRERLRSLGTARKSRLVVRRRAALLQAHGAPHRPRR